MNQAARRILEFPAVFLAILSLALTSAAQNNRINEREIGNLLTSINVKLDDFRYSLDADSKNNTISVDDEQEISESLIDLKKDINSLQDKLFNRADSREDVALILNSAKRVNDSVERLRLGRNSQNDWSSSRRFFDQLAQKYGVSWNWQSGANYPTQFPNINSNANIYNSGLTGTYQLDAARSESIQQIAQEATRDVDLAKREEARQDLEQKLFPPNDLAIDVRGNQVALASTLSSQITIPANGTERAETLADGSTIRLRATLRGQVLTVSTLGNENDYTVTFTPENNGQTLKVTRRVTTEYLKQTVFAESFYNKTDSVARLDGNYQNGGYDPNASSTTPNYPQNRRTTGTNPPSVSRGRTGQYIVPNGTILTGILENQMISTKVSRNNDRFALRIQSPNEFRGAIVEGYISGINNSGRVSGRSELTFNFETIRLPNGQSYDFAAYLQSVSNEKGERVRTDGEGSTKGDNKSNETIKRGGIGAGLGAILGGIIGGGKGAAIGAIIGGSAGAGSVYVQNDGALELRQGSTLTFQSSSPIR